MIVKSVELVNFRNHARRKVTFSPDINMIVGKNAAGKTNILEAIYMTCVGRTFRTVRDKDVVMFGKDWARVSTIAGKKCGDLGVEIVVGGKGKQIKINGIPISKMGELIGSLTCVFFNPEELKLVKDAPADRRRFLDIDISQIDKGYFYTLLKYNKILKQRNALLKTIGNGESEMRSLDIWDEELATAGERIIEARRRFCEELSAELPSVHKALAPDEGLCVQYEPAGVGALLDQIRAARANDLRLRTTTVGPHRDDLLITINGRDVRTFASQGQQRTAALSLKVAELIIFERVTGERPILLLDDVLSELDADRQERLLKLVQGWQVILTTTENVPRGTITNVIAF